MKRALTIIFAALILLGVASPLQAVDGQSSKRGARVDSFAPSYPFGAAVSQSNIDGVSFVEKFGHNHDVDVGVEDLWEGGGTYSFPTTATACWLMSTSATASQEITIQGLDVFGAIQSTTATINGTTPVLITDQATTPATFLWWRVFRAWNSDTSNVLGDVYIAQTNGNTNGVPSSGTLAIVDSSGSLPENQTLMAIYTIPTGKVGYLCKWNYGSSRLADTFPRLQSREFGKVFRTQISPSVYQSPYDYAFEFPLRFTARTDIKIVVESQSNNALCNGGFTIMLVDEQ
jgi:hypothetical protein